jgi:hypothetical protein
MTTTTKTWVGRKRQAPAKVSRERRPAKAEALAKDREERKKIGKTLDMAAFMADIKRDTTSAAYWETKE